MIEEDMKRATEGYFEFRRMDRNEAGKSGDRKRRKHPKNNLMKPEQLT
jgi:hypothetical protein